MCVCVCSGVCFSCDRGLEEACKCGKYLTQLVPAVSILCVCVRVCVCALVCACECLHGKGKEPNVSMQPQLCSPITLASDDSAKDSAGTITQTAVMSAWGDC